MYSGTLITELKSILVKEESPPETPVEQKSKCVYSFIFLISFSYLLLSVAVRSS